MNGEILLRIVGVSIIRVALIEKLAIYVVWCKTTPNNNCITTICLINYTLKYIKTYRLKHEIMVPVILESVNSYMLAFCMLIYKDILQ